MMMVKQRAKNLTYSTTLTKFGLGTTTTIFPDRIPKKNENIEINEICTICQGRVLLMEITQNKVKYCLVNIYSPNSDEQQFIENVFLETLGKNRDDYLIMACDWNAVLDNNLDKMGSAAQHANKNYRSHINNIIGEYSLCDIFLATTGLRLKFISLILLVFLMIT